MDNLAPDGGPVVGSDGRPVVGSDGGPVVRFDGGPVVGFDDDPDTRPVFPGYDAERLLGTGASAQVWLVQHVATGRLLAAKCFPPEESRTGTSDAALARELRILGNFTHDHLLTVHSSIGLAGVWAGGRALLMDYAPGGSLAGLVAARGPLSVGECVTVLTPLAQVLGYLHAEGVAHRDVSPGNVLFTAQGKPLLADFGVARMVGDTAQLRAGTPGFTADAAYSGDGACSGDGGETALDPAADVYAAAAVGWFALTGQVPRETDSRPPLSALAPDVPEELVAALEAGLHEMPSRRPTALEFAQAVYRSAPAAAIDLSSAVHPSVLPDLLTRRQVRRPAVRWYRPGSWTRQRQTSAPRRWEARRHGSSGLRGGGFPRAAGRMVRVLRTFAAAVVLLVLVGAGMLIWRPEAGGTGQLAEPDGQGSTVPTGEPTGDALATLAVPDAIRTRLGSNDPVEALGALAWLRSYAFSSGQPDLLLHVDAADSPAMAADAAVAARLQQDKHKLTGLESQVLNARELADDLPNSAHLSATTVTSGFAEQDQQGVVVRSQPDAATQQLLFVLQRAEQGYWRIAEVHLPAD